MGILNFLMWFFLFVGNLIIVKDGKGFGRIWDENGFNRVEGFWLFLDLEKLCWVGCLWLVVC